MSLFSLFILLFGCKSSDVEKASYAKEDSTEATIIAETDTTTEDVNKISVIGGCQIFPKDNFWNTPITELPVHIRSKEYISNIGNTTPLHPDFGSFWNNSPLGIPFDIIPAGLPLKGVEFLYDDESDCQFDQTMNGRLCKNGANIGLYPIPENPTIEGGSDDHIILLEKDTCLLYEVFNADKDNGGEWTGGSGAIWDLSKNEVRGDDMTSADAAGLAIFPGLVKFNEVYKKWSPDPSKQILGEITHALRVTLKNPQKAFIHPATHSDGNQGGGCFFSPTSNCLPMGSRIRLKESFDISNFDPALQVILRALKKYGLVIADTGGDMFMSGDHNANWDNDMLHALKSIRMIEFEVVDTGKKICPYPKGSKKCEYAK